MKNLFKKCLYCGERFPINPHGRRQLYCRPSHRVRACEKRKFAEFKEPSEKDYRLLVTKLQSLRRMRRKCRLVSDWAAASVNMNFRKPAYEQAVKRVRQALDVLAPEIFEAPPLPVSAPAGIELIEFSKVYRSLALEHHPDKGGSGDVMRAVNQLMQALQADLKRACP